MCKWLFKAGAAADISKANQHDHSPMHGACSYGHLSVCKWLFEVGTAADINRAYKNGGTPLKIVFEKEHWEIAHWLILKGALNVADYNYASHYKVLSDIPSLHRTIVVEWASEVVAKSTSFVNNFVLGTFHPEGSAPTTTLLRRALIATGVHSPDKADIIIKYMPNEIQQALLLQELRPVPALTLLRAQAGPLELIADFLDVLRGKELLNAKNAVDAIGRAYRIALEVGSDRSNDDSDDDSDMYFDY